MANKAWNATDFVDKDVITAAEMIKHSQMHGDLGTGRSATYTIAASDGPAHVKAQADYVCDGVDDQVTIQAAIDALPGGGIISFMGGDFSISAPIEYAENTIFQGAGFYTTKLKLANGANCNMFEFYKTATNSENFFNVFRDLYLDGNFVNNTQGTGIEGRDYIHDAIISGCFLLGFAEYDIYLRYGWNIRIENTIFEHSPVGLFARGQDIAVSNSKFLYNTEGIESQTQDFRVNSCFFYNLLETQTNHIDIQWSKYIDINNCGFCFGSGAGTGANNIYMSGTTGYVNIHDNFFYGANQANHSIYNAISSDLGKNKIHDNVFEAFLDKPIAGTLSTIDIRDNVGFVTENSGTASLLSATTSIAVTHGLAVTPVAGDIVIVPMETWGNMTKFWVDTYTATQFTIHADIAPGADTDFAWKAIVL